MDPALVMAGLIRTRRRTSTWRMICHKPMIWIAHDILEIGSSVLVAVYAGGDILIVLYTIEGVTWDESLLTVVGDVVEGGVVHPLASAGVLPEVKEHFRLFVTFCARRIYVPCDGGNIKLRGIVIMLPHDRGVTDIAVGGCAVVAVPAVGVHLMVFGLSTSDVTSSTSSVYRFVLGDAALRGIIYPPMNRRLVEDRNVDVGLCRPTHTCPVAVGAILVAPFEVELLFVERLSYQVVVMAALACSDACVIFPRRLIDCRAYTPVIPDRSIPSMAIGTVRIVGCRVRESGVPTVVGDVCKEGRLQGGAILASPTIPHVVPMTPLTGSVPRCIPTIRCVSHQIIIIFF